MNCITLVGKCMDGLFEAVNLVGDVWIEDFIM